LKGQIDRLIVVLERQAEASEKTAAVLAEILDLIKKELGAD
jgi:hypothetical protein